MGTLAQWVAPTLTFVGLVAGFIYFRSNRQRSAMGWTMLNNQPIIVRRPSTVGDDLQITFRGSPVVDPRAVLIRIQNVGTTAIKQETFVTPPTLSFGTAEIVAASVVGESTPGVFPPSPIAVSSKSNVTVLPALLNKGDWFEVQLVVDGPREVPSFDARFVGQTAKVSLIQPPIGWGWVITGCGVMALGLAILAVGVWLYGWSDGGPMEDVPRNLSVISSALIGVGFGMLFTPFVTRLTRRLLKWNATD